MDGIHIVAFAEEEDPGPYLSPVGLWSLAPEGELRFLCSVVPRWL